jgi:hypothetical protein
MVETYKMCKIRIDAVEQALAQALGGANVDQGASAGGASVAPKADADDVPF